MIRLASITENNYKDIMGLKVSKEQEGLVSSNVLSLAKAYVFRDIAVPFAIFDDDLMVGFIMLRLNEEYRDYFIWQFMIDARYQGRGYGKQAFEQAIEWMRSDGRFNQVVTTYIKGNVQAEKLYTQFGFQKTNEADDEIDMVFNL